ncbi:serine/threonine protein kinase [Pendulispora albinea]|uniref:Serine/threonine protein kinase n=2 Tax=Pendulispora albinea TaxID=2741071 RepID=A0ABZ2LT67_9BACT
MGEVFHAIHLASGMHVAVKVVSRAMIGDLLMARLEREAAAVSRIQSEYIPRLLDVDGTDQGELFLVMELLRGESLSERMKRAGGALSWDEVHAMGDNVLRALIDAHAAGVVHRDLKPGNIFIEHLPDGAQRAKVLDFGVCKVDVQDAEKLTITGESVGTIAYMAPEQIRGASRVDERADLYSFAMVVFEALAGRLAYDAVGQMALLASKLERPARSLNSVTQVPIPLALDALIASCLARRPADRIGSAVALLQAWRALGPPIQPAVSLGSLPLPVESQRDLEEPTAGALSRTHVTDVTTVTEVPRAPGRLAHASTRSSLVIAAATVLLGAAAVVTVVTRHARIGDAGDDAVHGAAAEVVEGARPPVEAPAASAGSPSSVSPVVAPVMMDVRASGGEGGGGAVGGGNGGDASRPRARSVTKRVAPGGPSSAGAAPTWIEKPKY